MYPQGLRRETPVSSHYNVITFICIPVYVGSGGVWLDFELNVCEAIAFLCETWYGGRGSRKESLTEEGR